MEYYVFDEHEAVEWLSSTEDLSQDTEIGDFVNVAIHNGAEVYTGRLVDRCDEYIYVEDCGDEIPIRTAHITSFHVLNM